MKKSLIISLFALPLFSLSSCGENNFDSLITKESKVLAYQAATSLNFINSISQVSLQAMDNEVVNLLPSINVILNNDNNFSSSLSESDREGYDYKQEISFLSTLESQEKYTLYYNATDTKTDYEDEEIETVIDYSGIAVVYDKDNSKHKELKFVGSLEKEVEKVEQEEELKIKIFLSEDQKSFIQVKQEKEVEEQDYEEEYRYELVINDERVYSFSIEKEIEDNIHENEIEIKQNDKIYIFKSYSENDKDFISIEIKSSSSKDVAVYEKIISDSGNDKIIEYRLVQ